MAESITPTAVTYTVMAHAWVAYKRWDRIEQALKSVRNYALLEMIADEFVSV